MIRINFAFKSNLTTWKDALVVHNDALNRFLLVIKIIIYIYNAQFLPAKLIMLRLFSFSPPGPSLQAFPELRLVVLEML